MRRVLLPLAVLLAGCIGAEAPPDPEPCRDVEEADCVVACAELPDCTLPCGERFLESEEPPCAPPGGRVGPPTLIPGTAWTFEGLREYDLAPRFTVIVVPQEDGYLFAGATEADVVFSAAWGERWYGPRGFDLARGDRELLRWPLEDGASWPISVRLTVTARAEDGRFVMTGENERVSIRYVYDPAVGFLTELRTLVDGAAVEDVRLVSNATASAAVWFEAGDIVVVPDPASPATFDLPAGFDALIVSAGGKGGARAVVSRPDGNAWTQDFPEDPRPEGTWVHEALPATPGRWTGSVAGWPGVDGLPDGSPRPVGWAYMHLVPVTWQRIPISP